MRLDREVAYGFSKRSNLCAVNRILLIIFPHTDPKETIFEVFKRGEHRIHVISDFDRQCGGGFDTPSLSYSRYLMHTIPQ